MPAADPLQGLNEAQRRAAAFGEPVPDGRGLRAGPLLVVAGAGTGKTMTLAHRVARLVLAGVPPPRILLLTFSRRAAREMTRRARRIVGRALSDDGRGGDVRLPWAGTFHSVANRLLREYAPNLGLDPGFSVLDRGDSADLMDVARQDLGLAPRDRRFPRKDTCLAIYSRTVNASTELKACLAEVFPCIRAIKSQDDDRVQPIIVFASAKPVEFNRGWLGMLGDFSGVDPISEDIARLTITPDLTDALLLTDDHNPIDLIRADEALRWRRRTADVLGDHVWF